MEELAKSRLTARLARNSTETVQVCPDGRTDLISTRCWRGATPKHKHFLLDEDIKRWYDNVSRGSKITADVYLRTNTWTNMTPAAAPPARWDHSMAYDAQSDRVILVGGHDGNTQYLDTWAYDFESNTWTNLKPSQAPTIIGLGDVAYDKNSDKIIQFGGLSPSLTDTGRTWAYGFHANSWTDRSPPSGPRARYFLAMAYDTESDWVIMFGGAMKVNAMINEDVADKLRRLWLSMRQ